MQPTSDQPLAEEPMLSKKNGPHKGLMVAATVVLALIIVGVAGWLVWRQMQPADTGEGADVTISHDGLSPVTIKVAKGDIVTWTNNDVSAHQILGDGDDSDINSGEDLNTGDSYNYEFDKAGTYTYYDPLNPNGFKGMVIVE